MREIDTPTAAPGQAAAELFRERFDPMVRLATLLTGSPHTAEELVMDAFARVSPRVDELDHPAAYLRTAQDAVARYSDDAALNGLVFDRHEEEVAVETFARALRTAGLSFVHDPMGAPQIPNWSRVTSALPDLLDELRVAVEADRRGRTLSVVAGGAS